MTAPDVLLLLGIALLILFIVGILGDAFDESERRDARRRNKP